MAFQLSLHSADSDIMREYPEGIDLVHGYEVALKSFVAYNNIPNISPRLQNNILHLVKHVYSYVPKLNDDLVTSTEGDGWIVLNRVSNPYEVETIEHQETKEIVFDTGTYELKDLQNTILQDKTQSEHKTEMIVDYVKMRVGIKSKWSIDMTRACSIGSSMLGYEKKLYPPTGDFIWSTKPIELYTLHTIRVKSNLTCSNIRDNMLHDSSLYEFPLAVGTGDKIIERPTNPEYYRVIGGDKLHHLRVLVVDQNDRTIDFLGEKITILLHFRPILY